MGDVKLDLTHRVKTATVASTTPFHMSTRVNATAHSWWMPEIRLAASELVEAIVARLNAWQLEVLIAYASIMRIWPMSSLQDACRSHRVLCSPAQKCSRRKRGGTLFKPGASASSTSTPPLNAAALPLSASTTGGCTSWKIS